MKEFKYYGEESVIDILHKQIKENNEEEKGKHDPCKFYPSSIGKCLRAIVYQMQGYESKPTDGRFLLIMDNGTYYHQRCEDLFGTTGLMIAPEVSFKVPDMRLSGRSDVLIKNFLEHTSSENIIKLHITEKETNESGETIETERQLYEGPDNDVIIVELKSISESGFKYLDRTGAKEAHKMQLMLYMHVMGI
jgi:hypothetical protein